jgi:hypothetical protein
LLVVALGGSADLLLANYQYRGVERRLGKWIYGEIGPAHVLVGPAGLTTSVSYYAQSLCGPTFPLDPTDEAVTEAVEQAHPDLVVLLVTNHMQSERFAALIDRIQKQGLKRTDPGRLPPGCERMHVLIRGRVPSPTAQKRDLTARAGPAGTPPR